MNLWLFLAAAVLLSFERIFYLWVWRRPERFREFCIRARLEWIGGPVDVLGLFFCGFKVLQCAVFLAWCFIYGHGHALPVDGDAWPLGLGAMMFVAGQGLNLAVFYRLGKIGVFYGNKLGHRIPWTRKFPFSCLKHPQYIGALLSIWGLFLVARFPHDDWYLLPTLETFYYGVSAYLERT